MSDLTHIQLDTCEILVGNSQNARGVKWVDVEGFFSIGYLQGATPVKGGKEDDGTKLYFAQAPYGNGDPIGVHTGKIAEGLDGES